MKPKRHAGSMRGTGIVPVANLPALIGPEAAAREYAEMVLEAQEARNRRGSPVYRGNGLLEWSDGMTVTLNDVETAVVEALVNESPRGLLRMVLIERSGYRHCHRVLRKLITMNPLLGAHFSFPERGRNSHYATTIRRG